MPENLKRRHLNIFKSAVKLLTSLVLSFIFLPVFISVTIPNELLRCLVSVLLKLFYGQKFALVPNGTDNIFHYKLQGNTRMCVTLEVFKDMIELQSYREHFDSKVLQRTEYDGGRRTYAKLKQTFVKKFGYYCLRNDSETFEICNHIKVHTEIGRDYFSEEELFQKIIPQLSQDMDESKPQWEIVIIPRVKFNDRSHLSTVVSNRCHHSIMDGLSTLMVNTHCIRDKEEKDNSEFDPLGPLPISNLQFFFFKTWALLLAPYSMVEALFKSWTSRKGRFSLKIYSGKRLYGWSEQIDFKLIQEIKEKSATKVSAILATALASTVNKLFEKYPRNSDNNFDGIPIAVINAMLPYKSIKPQNRGTITSLILPTGNQHWKERLHRINDQVEKLDPMTSISFYSAKWGGRLPWWCMESILSTGMGRGIQHLSLTNLPTGKKAFKVLGSIATEVGGFPILFMDNGIGAVTIRLANQLRFFLVGDKGCISKEEFQFCLQQLGKEIEKMALNCRQESFVEE